MTLFVVPTGKPDSPLPSVTGRKAGREPARRTAQFFRAEADFHVGESYRERFKRRVKIRTLCRKEKRKGMRHPREFQLQRAERWCRAERSQSYLRLLWYGHQEDEAVNAVSNFAVAYRKSLYCFTANFSDRG